MKLFESQSQSYHFILIIVVINLVFLWFWENYYYQAKNNRLLTIEQLQQLTHKMQSIQQLHINSEQILQKQIAETQQHLQIAEKRVVLPDQIAALMKSLTQSFLGITFNGLQNENDKKKVEMNGLYRHYFILTFSGNYNAITHYLDYLEHLPWQLGWESLDYQVVTYPEAKVSLHFYLYSPEESLIHG